MSLDEPRYWLHAAMVESDHHPEWIEMAKRQEAAEAESRARESRELLASETPEAEESRWSYRMQRRSVEIPRVHYAD